MSLYAEYIKEREGKEYVETEFGFFVYEIYKPYIYLSDVYIKPEMRKLGKCKEVVELVRQIGIENNCDKILTTYCIDDPNKERSRKVIELCGFTYLKTNNTMIWFEKDIK